MGPRIVRGDQVTVYYCPSRPRAFHPQMGMRGRMLDFFKFERRGLQNAIELDNPELVHAHWAYEFAWAALDSRRPCVVSFHDAPRQILRHMPSLYRLGRYFMAKRPAREAQYLTTVSPYMQHELKEWSGRDMALVPNPLDGAWFKSAQPAEQRDLQHPNIAMVINGWNQRKNPEPALKAFAAIREKLPGAQLHLFGKDFGPGQLAEQWCNNLHLSGDVTFHGMLTYAQLRQQLAQMTLLIHPALEESFGLSIAEAMALAIPVIGGETSGAVPWVCDNGKAGALVNVRSAREISDAALEILTDPGEYISKARHAQFSAQSRFSAPAVAAAYELLYLKAKAGESKC